MPIFICIRYIWLFKRSKNGSCLKEGKNRFANCECFAHTLRKPSSGRSIYSRRIIGFSSFFFFFDGRKEVAVFYSIFHLGRIGSCLFCKIVTLLMCGFVRLFCMYIDFIYGNENFYDLLKIRIFFSMIKPI